MRLFPDGLVTPLPTVPVSPAPEPRTAVLWWDDLDTEGPAWRCAAIEAGGHTLARTSATIDAVIAIFMISSPGSPETNPNTPAPVPARFFTGAFWQCESARKEIRRS